MKNTAKLKIIRFFPPFDYFLEKAKRRIRAFFIINVLKL